MTSDERLYTAKAMKKFGGSFVKALGECLLLADSDNVKRLEAAFPEYLEKYGSKSTMYLTVFKEHNDGR